MLESRHSSLKALAALFQRAQAQLSSTQRAVHNRLQGAILLVGLYRTRLQQPKYVRPENPQSNQDEHYADHETNQQI